jgi:hypothetical protein
MQDKNLVQAINNRITYNINMHPAAAANANSDRKLNDGDREMLVPEEGLSSNLMKPAGSGVEAPKFGVL